MPEVLSLFRLWHNNNVSPFPLTLGNPVADNQFGNHVVFTGVPSMSSGVSLTVPYYDGVQSTGVFLGSTASICGTFSVGGTSVYCRFSGLSSLARGTYQTYINGVSTGIPLKIDSDTLIVSLNHALCSSTHTFSPDRTALEARTRTWLATHSTSMTTSTTAETSPSSSFTWSLTTTQSGTSTRTLSSASSGSVTVTEAESMTVSALLLSLSRSLALTASALVNATSTATRTPTRTRTAAWLTLTQSVGISETRRVTASRANVTITHSVVLTPSQTWQCVDASALLAVFSPLSNSTNLAVLQTTDGDIRNGTTFSWTPAVLSNLQAEELHVNWFSAWEATAFVVTVNVPNQLGFVEYSGQDAGIFISCPNGLATPLGLSDALSPHSCTITVPLADYKIYSAEQ